MIIQQFPSLRKPTLPAVVEYGKGRKQQQQHQTFPYVRTPTSYDKEAATKFNITPEEFVRRDNVVRRMWIDCTLQVGCRYQAATEANRKLYGSLLVRGIYKSYHDFSPTEDWPDDDRPYIVTCTSENRGEVICMPEFLVKEASSGR